MNDLRTLANEHGLQIVEDACQAHGARIEFAGRWVHAGTVGTAGCFSFYPSKNLGAWGEAGAVATNDLDLAERIALLRDHGRISHYAHQEWGYNARLDTVQATVLRVKLRRLDRWNARRRDIADSYRELLANCGVELPLEPDYAQSCYHLFVVRSERRDKIRNALLANGVECGIHYPVPLHVQPACQRFGYRPGDFPHSEYAADTVLSLPMHPHLTNLDVVRVAELVQEGLVEGSDSFAGRQYNHETVCSPPHGE